MKTYTLSELTIKEQEKLTKRPAIDLEKVKNIATGIIAEVKTEKDQALIKLAYKFDLAKNTANFTLKVETKDFTEAEKLLNPDLKKALKTAYKNIFKFHSLQKTAKRENETETTKGIVCFREARAIERVGLYVPGGTATLPSTVLMLAIPAQIAGSSKIVLTTPPNKDGKIAAEILYTAQLCGITNIVKAGGAQAIAALAYGTESVEKVDKIFGPGNQFVTAAKMIVSQDESQTAIDMPAGPSEVLVIADKYANPNFVAADLLSQAEHGTDSQAVCLCYSQKQADEIAVATYKQLQTLPRQDFTKQALENSFVLVCKNEEEAINFSNKYAPEHLIINTKKPESLIPKVINAGSVFLGAYTPESLGDYASGTNHSLPTYGYAKMYSGVSVDSFLKKITFQQASFEGLKNIAETVTQIATAEELEAHKLAVEIRGA